MLPANYKSLSDDQIKSLSPQIEEWKKKDFEPVIIEVDLGEDGKFEGIFKTPGETEMKLITESDLKGRESDSELSRMCVLYPDIMTFNDIIDKKYWGITTPIAKKLLHLTHVTKEAKVKKL